MIQKTARNEYELGNIFPFNDLYQHWLYLNWWISVVFIKGEILLCTEEFISAGLFHCYSLLEPYLKSPIKTVTVHKGKATHNVFLKTLYVAVNKG